MRFISIFLLLFYCAIGIGQSTISITINGTVVSFQNEPVNNCYIKIGKFNSNTILAFFSTSKSNSFTFKQVCNLTDTLVISVSNFGYEKRADTIIVKQVDNNQVSLDFVLNFKSKELPVVLLNASPLWKRGDTTFYRIDAYKELSDRKLADLIEKLPYFQVSENGRLLFKNKPIDKIMIEGEEIFADKIILLLKSLPVNALQTIEAIENQNSNKLLKGFAEDTKTVLNLKLKKDKLNAVFGDAEVGAGAGAGIRYKTDATLFSIKKRVKFGYIGNYNNTGKSLSIVDRYGLFPKINYLAEYRMIPTYTIQTIPNFEENWYVLNRLADNRFQVNIPVGNKIKIKTELLFIKDRQQQVASSSYTQLSGGNYIIQNLDKSTQYKPVYFNYSSEATLPVDSLTEFFIKVSYNQDKTSNYNRVLLLQDSLQYLSSNLLANKWRTLYGAFTYIKKTSKLKAIRITGGITSSHLNQLGLGISPDWYTIFTLPDRSLTNLAHIFNNQYLQSNISFENLRKGKQLFTWKLSSEWTRLKLDAPITFSNPEKTILHTIEPVYSGNGQYSQFDLFAENYSRKKILKTQATFQIKAGLSVVSSNERQIKNNFNKIQPLISLITELEKAYSRKVSSRFSLLYTQQPIGLFNTGSSFYPTAIGSFRTTKNGQFSNPGIYSYYSLNLYSLNSSTFNISFNCNQKFVSSVFNPVFNSLISTYADSLVKKPTSNLYFGTNYSFPVVPINAKITLKGSAGIQETLVLFSGSIKKTNALNFNIFSGIKQQWGEIITIHITNSFLYNVIKLNDVIQSKAQIRSGNLVNSIQIKIHCNKQSILNITGRRIENNLFTNSRYKGFFSDAEFRHILVKSKISLSIKVDNITDQKKYSSFNAFSAISQSIFSVPLVRRNILLSALYEL